MKICAVSEMQAMDKSAIGEYHIPELILMENAGLASVTVIEENYGVRGNKFLIFCGGGNNGGDGFVVGRKIHSEGGSPTVILLADENKFQGAARANLDLLKSFGITPKTMDKSASIKTILKSCDVIIDAVFGTGLTRPVEGEYADVIEKINTSGKPVVSLDIPSGINGNNGQVMGTAVQARHTITYGLPKYGNILYPGYKNCGTLHLSHISFPPVLYQDNNLKVELNDAPPLPPRNPAGHKGSFGKVLFIAGAANYYGAPYFSAYSFLKAGGGYSNLAAPDSVISEIALKAPEIVYHPQKSTAAGSMSLENLEALLEITGKMDMVVAGPGLSLDDESQELVRRLAAKIEKPLLIDGDGITAVSQDPAIISKRTHPTILTPHLGEMTRLTGKSANDIEADPVGSVLEAAAELNAVVVLKGAHSLIGLPDGRVFINPTGNSGMGTAGSGDLLTGIIAAMYGLELETEDAARKGVFIHGYAGDLAAQKIGEDGISAGDILDCVPEAVSSSRLDKRTESGFIIKPVI